MNNSTDYSLDDFSDTVLDFIILAIFLLAMVITLVTNTVTIVVMVTTPKLRTRTNAFIASLAVSDTLFAVYFIIIMVKFISSNWDSFGSFIFWAAADFAWNFQVLSSYGNPLLVSLERWLYIAKPFLYQRCVTKRAVICSITITWIIAFGGIPPLVVGYNLTFILHTVLFIALVAIYAHICHITLKHLKKLPKSSHQAFHRMGRDVDRPKANKTLSIHAENWNSIKLMVIICGSFFLFVSPYVYHRAYKSFMEISTKSALTWYMFCIMLSTIFHSSNFFVYALAIPLFRKTIWKRFHRLGCCRGSQLLNGRGTSNGST